MLKRLTVPAVIALCTFCTTVSAQSRSERPIHSKEPRARILANAFIIRCDGAVHQFYKGWVYLPEERWSKGDRLGNEMGGYEVKDGFIEINLHGLGHVGSYSLVRNQLIMHGPGPRDVLPCEILQEKRAGL